jgi:hypothetical protein
MGMVWNDIVLEITMCAIAFAQLSRPPSYPQPLLKGLERSITTANFKIHQYIGMGRFTDISFIVTGVSRGGEVSPPSRGHSTQY